MFWLPLIQGAMQLLGQGQKQKEAEAAQQKAGLQAQGQALSGNHAAAMQQLRQPQAGASPDAAMKGVQGIVGAFKSTPKSTLSAEPDADQFGGPSDHDQDEMYA